MAKWLAAVCFSCGCMFASVSSGAEVQEPDWNTIVANNVALAAEKAPTEKGLKAIEQLDKVAANEKVPISLRTQALWAIGRARIVRQQRKEALACFAGAEKLSAELKSPQERLPILLSMFAEYDAAGAQDELGACGGRVMETLTKVEDPSQRIETLFTLTTAYSKYQGLRDKATSCLGQAEKTAASLEPVWGTQKVLCRTCVMYAGLGNSSGVIRVASAVEPMLESAPLADGEPRSAYQQVLGYHAQALAQEGKIQEAAGTLAKQGDFQKDGGPYYAAAELLAKNEQMEPSVLMVKKALAKYPEADCSGYIRALAEIGMQFVGSKQYDTAIHCFRARMCFLGPKAGDMANVLKAQQQIIDALLIQGKRTEAISEAKRYFTLCDIQSIGAGLDAVARVYKAADHDINLRVKTFLDYERYGAAGPDGKPDTKDDLTNPLDAVALEVPKESELLDAVVARVPAGDNRLRGYALLLKGDTKAALSEFRCGYASANNTELTAAIYDVATALKAIDGDVFRANQYLLFQTYGAAGKDGKTGTADDLTDPLKGIPIQLPPDRMQALDKEIQTCGADYQGVRRQAYLLLSANRAEEGLKKMLDAYALSDINAASLQTAILDVAAAIKGMDGNVFRANRYLLYQKYGKAGADGKEGTPDDLIDPLAQERAPVPAEKPPEKDAVAPHPPEEKTAPKE